VIEKFIGTKSRQKNLGGQRRKVDIFIRNKNICNSFFYDGKTL